MLTGDHKGRPYYIRFMQDTYRRIVGATLVVARWFELILLYCPILSRLACATLFAALCCGFALAACLGAFIVGAAACLGENAVLLHFTIELFEGDLERVTWVYAYFTHCCYQLDLRSLERPLAGLIVWKQSLQ